MGKPTEKMIGFLKQKGIDGSNMSFEEASAKIGEIKSGKPLVAQTAGIKEYHLTPEECRARALESAIETYKIAGVKPETDKILAAALIYEAYIIGHVQ